MRGRSLLVILSIAFLVFQTTSAQNITVSDDSILFHDDFESGDLGAWDNSQQRGEIIEEADGNHVLRLTGSEWSAILMDNHTWTDYAVEARIKIVQPTENQTNDLFFVVRGSSNGDGYNAYLSVTSVTGMGMNLNGQYVTLPASYIAGMPFVRADTWHIFRFQVFGNQLKLYFDNQLIAEYTDTENQFSNGNVALVTAPNVVVHFDDVYVLSADVPTGLAPQTIVFEFDNASAPCDYTALPASSNEILTGTTLRELNVRTEPNTSASVVTFLNEGDTFTFSDEAVIGSEVTMRLQLPLIWSYASITNDTWLGVEVMRNGNGQSGYIWGRAVEPTAPTNPFINPYDDCIAQENTTGWAEILRSEFGESWLSFGTPLQQNFPTTVTIMLVLDGIWIEQPIPLYDAQANLLGIAHLSMRGYYLDARGDLQSVLMALYVQTSAAEAYLFFMGPTALDLTGIDFMPPNQVRRFYENVYPDLRGTVVCTTVTEDMQRMLNYFGGGAIAGVEKIETYWAAHSSELARFIFAGDPGIGVLWSFGNRLHPCSPGEESVPLNLP